MTSIMQNEEKCYVCGTTVWLESHHIFGRSNRDLSEKYGLKVYLCHRHHNEPPNGVHHNKELMTFLHEEGQKAFEMHYPDLSFRELFGINYL